jgi:uncharacterized protein
MDQEQDVNSDNTQIIDWQYEPGPAFSGFPWGPHKLPVRFEFDGFSGSLDQSGEGFLYRREYLHVKLEKTILAGKSSIYFCPAEPFHYPEEVSQHLLINIDQPVLLEPRATTKIFLTFPIEIALVLARKRSSETVLDLISLLQPKLTLYGNIKDGLVCRYWKSNVHETIPRVNPIREGVMQLTISNSGNRWAEIKQALFSARAMKIYYNPHLVALQAVMKLSNELSAETAFIDEPLKTGMKKAPEQFSARRLSLPGRLLMEEGY